MAKYYSTKTYGTDRGFSCCFRQWKAKHSHCSFLHGYSLGFKLIFECESLDERNWVMDFGGLKDFKLFLEKTFDHTLLIASDDPYVSQMLKLSDSSLADVRIVSGVGCEKFAEIAYAEMNLILKEKKKNGTLLNQTVKLKSVEVFEHAGNSAIYEA
tara:strand:- start:40 stop:507 length:468 start_codon:yes stop_codon:yes gene_type:complete